MTSHALLSPSGASRWLTCTPSARLTETFPSTSSEAADEGTLAHSFCEAYLKRELSQLTKVQFKRTIEQLEKEKLYLPEMHEYAENYACYVMEQYNRVRAAYPMAAIFIEQKFELFDYVPEGYGTSDCTIYGDGTLITIDYKHGKGVRVPAHDNKQLKLYALGALSHFSMAYDVENVEAHIYQPRIDNIDSFNITAADLIEWGENEVRVKALQAFAGEGDYVVGEHCRFCAAKGVCRANAEANLQMAKYEFRTADLLTHEEVSAILDKADQFLKWISAVTSQALFEAVSNGVKYPGYKLVEGRSNRVISDEQKVREALEKAGLSRDKYIIEKLAGITALEKELGKAQAQKFIGDYIIKPPGKPTLVPSFDKRPELNTADAAASDFADILQNELEV